MKKQTGLYHVVGSKLPKEEKAKLAQIANNYDMKLSKLLQCVLLTLLQYFDKETPLNEKCHNLIYNFSENNNISSNALYFLESAQKDKKGCVYIEQSRKGQLYESYNIDKMLELFLSATDERLLNAIRKDKEYLGEISIFQTLKNGFLNNIQQNK